MPIIRALRQGVAAALACAAAASAHAIDIHVGSTTPAAGGSPYGSFEFVGDTFTVVSSPAPVAVSLGTLSFAAGPDCAACGSNRSFDALFDITIGGSTQQVDLPYVWHANSHGDFLTFSTPSPVVFDFASLGLVKIVIDAPPKLVSTGAAVYQGVSATVAVTPVPEPTTLALFLSGIGVIGFIARRRR